MIREKLNASISRYAQAKAQAVLDMARAFPPGSRVYVYLHETHKITTSVTVSQFQSTPGILSVFVDGPESCHGLKSFSIDDVYTSAQSRVLE